MADPEVGMKVDLCLEGHSPTVVSPSNFRANQMNNALRNEGFASSIEAAPTTLAQNFHAKGVPEQIVRALPQPALAPVIAPNIQQNA